MENETLATELLKELKANGKRWFRAFIIMVALEVATIIGFLWYISLPVEEYSMIEQESDNASRNFVIGGDNYGGETEGYDIQAESNEK